VGTIRYDHVLIVTVRELQNCSLLVLSWCVALYYWSGKCGSPLVGLLLAHTNVVTLLIHLLTTNAGLRGTYNLLPDTL